MADLPLDVVLSLSERTEEEKERQEAEEERSSLDKK